MSPGSRLVAFDENATVVPSRENGSGWASSSKPDPTAQWRQLTSLPFGPVKELLETNVRSPVIRSFHVDIHIGIAVIRMQVVGR